MHPGLSLSSLWQIVVSMSEASSVCSEFSGRSEVSGLCVGTWDIFDHGDVGDWREEEECSINPPGTEYLYARTHIVSKLFVVAPKEARISTTTESPEKHNKIV